MKWFNFPFSPEAASTVASQHDAVFYTITALVIFFTLAVSAVVVYFTLRYRHGNKVDRSNPQHHNDKLEVAWSLPPLVLGLIVFFAGAQLFLKQRIPPKDCYEVYVVGKQWMWHMQHPNGVRENNQLHIPVGRPVRVTMISQDVIHAFYIPEFRVQYYTVPGRYTSMWFEATKAGTYHLFCNLYCGTQHSEMGGTIVAMNQKDFAQWLQNGGENGAPETMEAEGAKLFDRLACANCHGAVDGPNGPSLVGIAGTERTMTDGSKMVADQSYLREQLINPWGKLTKGYTNTMPAYKDQITEEQILALTSFIRSMSTKDKAPVSGMDNVQTGEVQSKRMTGYPTMRVGALGNQTATKAPTVTKGNLAIGAIAAQKGDQYRK